MRINSVFIQTNTSITVKTDDGSKIKLKLLKHPIDIEDLIYENEIHVENNDKNLTEQKITKYSNIVPQDLTPSTISIVEVPVSLDDFVFKNANDSTSVSHNLKLIKNKLPNFVTKREPLRSQTWEQNALTLFEFSHVYPFIDICNKYKCIVCAQEFLDAAFLKEHLTAYHTIEDLNRELSNRIRDRTIKVDVSCLQCKICEICPPDLPALKSHLKAHGKLIDPDYQDNIVPFKLGGNSFECQICSEPFPKLRSIIIHMSKHFNNYTCETCGSVFITLHLLNRHLETHKIGHYPCFKCEKVFSNSNKRARHIQSVHQKKIRRKCPICPERFISNYQRTKHLRIAHNKTSGLFRCESCGKTYEMKSQLLVHIRSVHMQERNQECSICMSRFFSKNSLSRHMTIHTGNRNFKCGLCGKAYARKKNLKDHVKSHEDGSVCYICGRDCGDNSSLMLHISTSHVTHE